MDVYLDTNAVSYFDAYPPDWTAPVLAKARERLIEEVDKGAISVFISDATETDRRRTEGRREFPRRVRRTVREASGPEKREVALQPHRGVEETPGRSAARFARRTRRHQSLQDRFGVR